MAYVDETVRVVRAGAAGGLVKGKKSDMKEDEFYFFMTKIEEGGEEQGGEGEEGEVLVGSRDYYKGFLEQPLGEDLTERDPMGGLDQALKLGGGAAAFLSVLFLLFMKSNNLI